MSTTTYIGTNVTCPACLEILSAARSVNSDSTPSPGNASVCAYCGTFLVFKEDLHLREMTVEEIGALPPAERILLRLGGLLSQLRRPAPTEH